MSLKVTYSHPGPRKTSVLPASQAAALRRLSEEAREKQEREHAEYERLLAAFRARLPALRG